MWSEMGVMKEEDFVFVFGNGDFGGVGEGSGWGKGRLCGGLSAVSEKFPTFAVQNIL